jgi:phenylpropionate dioxygenase-like ring-hydroxylating dioxygenase large terminal subunit
LLLSFPEAEPLAEERQSQAPLGGIDDPLLLGEWLAVAWSSEIEPGKLLARRLLGRDVVLWRSSEGLHCWRDLCIHRGARLSLGSVRSATNDTASPMRGRDCLICPYHAWEYAPTGECVRIPAHPDLVPPSKAHAETFHVRERYGVVWVSMGTSRTLLPEFPIAEQSGFRIVLAGPYRFRAQGPRVIENLLDVAHLGFVHAGLLGDAGRGEIEDYEVTAGTDTAGPEAKHIRVWQPDPDGTGSPALVTYHYSVHGPLTASFVKSQGIQQFAILAQTAPIDADISETRLVMCLNYGSDTSDEELTRFQDLVTEQDRLIVESQRPELLPLDLQEELHLRSDRMAIAYRKWLRTIGLKYGTA